MTLTLDQCVLEIEGLLPASEPKSGWGSIISAHQYRPLLDFVRDVAPAPARILDWGCGRGFLAYWLVGNGYDVAATDFWEIGLVPILLRRDPERFSFDLAADPVALPYGDGEFDHVISAGVLEHVREGGGTELGSLAEIHRVLRPGGRLFVTHLPSQRAWPDEFARRFMPRAHTHQYRYSLGDVRTMLTQSGFELDRVTRTGAIPRNPLSRLPRWISDSPSVARALDATDRAACELVGDRAQNIAFIARRV